ncbi:hypothetical protein ABZ949_01765 [Micromonospora tulbaghiae]|uniref:hypothetical protein n=1 Tax=Micromonospora tulbaghiae TaxID=479978 RepID=UPI0033EE8F4D
MSSILNLPFEPAGNGEDTDAWRVRLNRLGAEQKKDDLRDEIAAHRPSPGYVRLTTAAIVATAIEWVALTAHTVVADGAALDAWLATHQVVTITVTVVTACLGIGWAMWADQCRREARHDRLAETRHELQMAEIRRLFKAMLREGDMDTFAALSQTQQYLDEAARGTNVMQFPTSRRTSS